MMMRETCVICVLAVLLVPPVVLSLAAYWLLCVQPFLR